MTYKELKSDIDTIKKAHDGWSKVFDKLIDLFSCNPDGGLIELVDGIIDSMVDLVTTKHNDKYEWIKWFIYDNEFGKNAQIVKFYGEEIVVKTVRDLYEVMKNDIQKTL